MALLFLKMVHSIEIIECSPVLIASCPSLKIYVLKKKNESTNHNREPYNRKKINQSKNVWKCQSQMLKF